ncbi:hypothetical protein RvY_05773 [Ramazzottius varieornatus]|uniref:Uncharacterized protein n=1 Tax=Ramazzottius varieornatus TaxID=947166 RepID=A0A1D1UZ73_RAMVA|nr:hypothetical protein RvY_05773 [Ramazzottius varieornatus]
MSSSLTSDSRNMRETPKRINSQTPTPAMKYLLRREKWADIIRLPRDHNEVTIMATLHGCRVVSSRLRRRKKYPLCMLAHLQRCVRRSSRSAQRAWRHREPC